MSFRIWLPLFIFLFQVLQLNVKWNEIFYLTFNSHCLLFYLNVYVSVLDEYKLIIISASEEEIKLM